MYEMTMNAKQFADAYAWVQHAAARRGDLRYYLADALKWERTGEEELTLIATDGHRMHVATLDCEFTGEDAPPVLDDCGPGKGIFFAPQMTEYGHYARDDRTGHKMTRRVPSVGNFPRKGKVTIIGDVNGLHVTGASKTPLLLSCDGKFPDWRRVVPTVHRFFVVRAEAAKAFVKAAPKGFGNGFLEYVRLAKFTADKVSLLAGKRHAMTESECLEVQGHAGVAGEVAFDVKYFRDALTKPGKEVTWGVNFHDDGEISQCMVVDHNDGRRAYVMQTRW